MELLFGITQTRKISKMKTNKQAIVFTVSKAT